MLPLARAVQTVQTAQAGIENAAVLSHCALIDFGGVYAALKPFVGAYMDLSPEGDAAAAGRGVYAALRWTEQAAGENTHVKLALLPSAALASGDTPTAAVLAGHGMAAAVVDRLYRAASGKQLPACGKGAPFIAHVAAAVKAVLPAEHAGGAVKHV
jgi:hypothetical protein